MDTYHCGDVSLVVTESWNFKISRRRQYAVSVDGKPLSDGDARLLEQAIHQWGPFQALSVYCIDGLPHELAFFRYTPTAEELHVYFDGSAIKTIRPMDRPSE